MTGKWPRKHGCFTKKADAAGLAALIFGSMLIGPCRKRNREQRRRPTDRRSLSLQGRHEGTAHRRCQSGERKGAKKNQSELREREVRSENNNRPQITLPQDRTGPSSTGRPRIPHFSLSSINLRQNPHPLRLRTPSRVGRSVRSRHSRQHCSMLTACCGDRLAA